MNPNPHDPAAALRAQNAALAASYDALPYEPPPLPEIAPERALGLGVIHGCGAAPGTDLDVLDLGCGGGALLAQAGAVARGRLLGIDISGDSCERARRRLLPFGARAQVQQADFLDLDPAALGRFDVIYLIGVLFVTPPRVRRHLLALVTRCLRPGGVAVLSYYAGSLPRVRACLHDGLRAATDPMLPRQAQVRAARQRISHLAASLPPAGPQREVLAQALQLTSDYPDTVLFHEALAGSFTVLETSAMATTLRRGGVHFLGYLMPTPFGALPTSRARALGADAFDFTSGGGYRYAVYGRHATESRAPSLRSPWLRLGTGLGRLGHLGPGEPRYDGPASYRDAGATAHIARAGTQALLDELAAGPAPFPALCAGARRRLAARGLQLTTEDEALMERDVLTLWQSGLVTPESAP